MGGVAPRGRALPRAALCCQVMATPPSTQPVRPGPSKGETAGVQARESSGDRLRRSADDLCGSLIEASWLVALTCIPVYFNIYSSRSFEPDKAALLKILAGVIGATWLARALVGGTAWPRRNSITADRQRAGVVLLAAVAALLVAAIVSTALSVSPWRSYHGSFGRQQGLTTLLAYLTIAGAVAVNLRWPDQWRRAVMAITLGSVPVSVYAVVQRLGLDIIVPADDALRVSSSLGNPIFLGGYLAMAFLVTVFGSRATPVDGGIVLGPLRRLAHISVAGLQLAALVLSQSRGPALGLVAGLVVSGVVWTQRGRSGTRRRRAWVLVIAAAVTIIALLAIAALPDSPLARLRELPTVGRIAAALDPTSPTARVRLLIWRGVVELETSAPPLRGSAGEIDRLHRLRPLIGYGPECFDLAFNRVLPAELGVVESRDSIPDRAHCETLDALVTTGAAGLAAWVILVAGALAVAASRAVGRPVGAPAVTRGWLWSLAGGAAVAGLAVALGRADVAGPLATAGLLAGLCAATVHPGSRAGAGTSIGNDHTGRRIALAALTGIACHVVDASVGIPATPSRLLFWFLFAALVADRLGRIDEQPTDPGVGTEQPHGATQERMIEALLAGTALAVAAYSLMDTSAIEIFRRIWEALSESVWEAVEAAGSAPTVVVVSAVAAQAVLWSSCHDRHFSGRARLAALTAFALPLLALVAFKSHRFAITAEMQRRGASFEAISAQVALHAEFGVGAIVAVVLLLAVVLARGRPSGGDQPRFHPTFVVGVVITGFVITAAALVARPALAPIRADTIAKHAAVAIDRGQPLLALSLLSRASWLVPGEPSLMTLVARASVLASRLPVSAEGRRLTLDAAVAALERAAGLQPFDPDHPVNLGRVLIAAAALSGDTATRQTLLEHAESAYGSGLDLRPGSVLFRVEHAGVLAQLGRNQAAVDELTTALALDPGYEAGADMLAGLERVTARIRSSTASSVTDATTGGP